MIYFKHSDLSDKYHVSLKTVHNWIDGAKQGKVNLKLHSVTNRTYVANTPENLLVLNDLADKGKKYRNTLHHKIIQPKPEFYEILKPRQILDIINHLNVHKELPKQYNYLKNGATVWDKWVKRLATENSTNVLNGSLELIHANMNALDRLLVDNKKVNVIDIGAGNAYPVKELIEHLYERGILNRYIALDISPEMLSIAEQNTKEWLGDDFPYEGHVRDMTRDQFDDLLVDDGLSDNAENIINLVLLLGGTPTNLPSYADPFRIAYNSMGSNDLLLHTIKPDSEVSRQYFDFNSNSANNPEGLSSEDQNGYLLNLLNIDPSLYEVERGFEPKQMFRYVRVRLKTSITVHFNFDKIEREVILEKGETILLLRMVHLSAIKIISEQEKVGFTLLQSSLTRNREFLLTICGLEKKPSSN